MSELGYEGEQGGHWRPMNPVKLIYTWGRRSKAAGTPEFAVTRVACPGDPLIAEQPGFVCNLRVPGALDEDTGEKIEELVRGCGHAEGSCVAARERAADAASAPRKRRPSWHRPRSHPRSQPRCPPPARPQLVQGEGPTSWEAKVSAANTAAEILSRYALWGARMVDPDPAPSLWGTVALALSDLVRGRADRPPCCRTWPRRTRPAACARRAWAPRADRNTAKPSDDADAPCPAA